MKQKIRLIVVTGNRSVVSVSNLRIEDDDASRSVNTTRVSSVTDASSLSATTSTKMTRSRARGLSQIDKPIPVMDIDNITMDVDVVPSSSLLADVLEQPEPQFHEIEAEPHQYHEIEAVEPEIDLSSTTIIESSSLCTQQMVSYD